LEKNIISGKKGAGESYQVHVAFHIGTGNFRNAPDFIGLPVVRLDDADAGKPLPDSFGHI